MSLSGSRAITPETRRALPDVPGPESNVIHRQAARRQRRQNVEQTDQPLSGVFDDGLFHLLVVVKRNLVHAEIMVVLCNINTCFME